MLTNMLYPLVSVRIPLYNHSSFVEECLNSIFNDSYPNKEIVIVDDGSKDDSKHIVEKWIENHKNKIEITFISRENRGVTKTLNELNRICAGEYIVGIASDDYLLPDSIMMRYEYMQEKNCKVLFADCVVVDERSQIMHESALKDIYKVDTRLYLKKETLDYNIINNWSVPGGTLMVHRSVYDEFVYDEKSIVEDYDFFLYTVAKDMLCYFDKTVSAYRIHSNNSHANSSYYKRQVSMIKALLRNISYFSNTHRSQMLKKAFWFLKKIFLKTIRRKR